MATASKGTTARKTDSDPKSTIKAPEKTHSAPYGEQALTLANDSRALVEDIRADLAKLTDRVTDSARSPLSTSLTPSWPAPRPVEP